MPILEELSLVIFTLELLHKFHLLSKRQKEILEEFNDIEINKPDPVIKNFFEKAKKFWKKS